MLKQTFKTAAAALAITVGVTSIGVSSAQATMANHGGGHSRNSGHSSSGTAVAIGVLGALAIMSAIQQAKQAQQAKPAYVKRRCAQYTEWRKLMKNAKNNARVQLTRGDQRGANSWLRSARTYAAKADAARRDCRNW